MTWKDIDFKVMTTDPGKYSVRPNWGIILPGSSLDIIVTTRCLKALPPDQQCADKLKIKSVFASPHATAEDDVRQLLDKKAGDDVWACELGVIYTFPSQALSAVAEESASSSIASGGEYTNSSDLKMGVKKLPDTSPSEFQFTFELKQELSCSLRLANMTENHVFSKFDEAGSFLEEVKLRVVYTFPSHPQSSTNDKSEAGFSSDASTLPNINSNDPGVTQVLDRNESNVGPLFLKGITIGLLGLIFWYIMVKMPPLIWMKMLPLIWNLTFMIMMLVVKMIKKMVSDSIEDWIRKCLVDICNHFRSVIFGRKASMSVT